MSEDHSLNIATASIREVYALVGQVKAELSQQITTMKQEMLDELKLHELAHAKEDQSRKSRLRFAVTVAVGLGTLLGGSAQWLLTQILR